MSEASAKTSETLILRLRDPGDDSSWREFVEIYTPLLYGYCINRGLGAADSADIVQEVMRSVSLAMRSFKYDPAKGKFKGWLFTATRNSISKHFRNQSRRPVTASDTKMLHRIEQTPNADEIDEWETDYQRKLLAWAMEKVKPQFAERIWRAFELTAIEGRDPGAVAETIGMTKNAVAIAKCRVMQRLREKAGSVDADHWEGEIIAGLQKV